MATLMLMPKLSDTMDEGIILKWRKREGESIRQGDILADIQSDKADMEQEAYDSGIVRKLFAGEGQGVKVGAPLAIVGTADEDIGELLRSSGVAPLAPAARAGVSSSATASGTNADVSVAATSVGITNVGISVAATSAGVSSAGITAVPVDMNAIVVASSVGVIASKLGSGRVKISPLAKKIAADRNIDVSRVSGSGPSGRIVKRDVENYSAPVAVPTVGVRTVFAGETKDIPLSLMRRTIARRLVESKVSAPHFYLTVETDMAPAIAFRASINAGGDVKISFNDIIVKGVALSLRIHPEVNATFTPEKILQYIGVHVGIAVAIDDGLITPVIRNADRKGLGEISAEIKELAVRARNKKLIPEEFTGGTFTISNLGMYDVENFAAIINPPEGAILAVGSIREQPVVENQAIVVGMRMKMTLSCDHRVVDGATGARFMQTLKKIIEHPARLAL